VKKQNCEENATAKKGKCEENATAKLRTIMKKEGGLQK
jgi:hypothetical protein